MVEIELEEFFSETDDEELQVVSPVKKSEAKKSNHSDSISDCESSRNEENDHLKIFE